VDVDAAAKLAHWQMLMVLPGLLQVGPTDCAVLTSLEFRAKKRIGSARPDKVFANKEAAEMAIQFAALAGRLDAVEPLAELQDVPDIDPGEAVLLSAAIVDRRAVIITGDKRAIRAVAQLAPRLREKLAGRIMCLEQILLKALAIYGLEWLRDHVCISPRTERSALVIMGSRCDAPIESVQAALSSYIGEMASLCEPSLLRSD